MDEETVALVDWVAIRAEYEARTYTTDELCHRHGITQSKLRYRREREGWVANRVHLVKSSDLINRMFKILNKQVRLLENAVTEPVDKLVGALSTTVKSYEKLVELGAADRDMKPTNNKDMRDLRDKLAKRLDQFKQR
jgi:hypothetical protein